MSTGEKIITAITGLGLVCFAEVYTGTLETFTIYNYEDVAGDLFADNEPQYDVDSVQIHYFQPRTSGNPDSIIRSIRNALINVGFDYPDISRFYDEETDKLHIVFSTEIVRDKEE